jgi:diguanylate cyclase (GGDEF)-like protein
MVEENEVKNLELLGHDVVEEAGEDTAAKKIHKIKDERKEIFYSDLLHALMNLRFSEEEARKHWAEIVKHKWVMSEKLKRNVGVRVAALDYFKNIKGLIRSPKIVEVSEFAATSWRAITDSLTELYNHRYFQNAVNREVKRVREKGDCFSILLFDIDFFKIYNDTNGHIAGDVVLVEVARILKKNVREEDVAARYGGEEFGVVIPNAGKEKAFEIAERIRTAVKEFKFANEGVLPSGQVTISAGLATCPEDGKTRRKLVSVVDRRLYKAKWKGRDQICMSSE